MELRFANPDLEAVCSQEKVAKKQLGAVGAKRLQSRVADLMASSCVTDLIAGHPHPLAHDRAGQFAVDLDGGRRLVFAPSHDPVPIKDDGGIAWENVTAVTIVFIGDYHD